MKRRSVLVVPPALSSGARIAVVAPGSAIDGELLEAGLDVLRRFGFEPVCGKYLRAAQGDLAGSDRQRGRDLLWALTDPKIDAVWAARGGWGAPRLLRGLDWQRITRDPKWLIGFSDLTLLQAALLDRGVPSLYAPVVVELANPSRVPDDTLARWLRQPDQTMQWRLNAIRGARRANVRGPLAGGCLTLLVSSVGTPWQPDWRGCIVFVEEVGEAPYRIDRMLWQLRESGAFAGIAGLVFGQFTRCEPAPGRGSRPLADIFREHVIALNVPALHGLPVGHGPGAVSVPIGYPATLEVGARRLTIAPPL